MPLTSVLFLLLQVPESKCLLCMFCSAVQLQFALGEVWCCGVVADRCLAVHFLILQLPGLRIFCALEEIIVFIQKKTKLSSEKKRKLSRIV